jgi:HSP20 family protein
MATNVGRYLTNDPMFDRLERQMDDLVARLLRRTTPASYQRAWSPRTDVYETDEEFIAVVELAEVDPGGVTIEIEGEQVSITGQRAPSKPPEGAECLQLEIPFGAFECRMVLPATVDASQAKAEFTDGMLRVRLPKLRRGPTRVQVEVQRAE